MKKMKTALPVKFAQRLAAFFFVAGTMFFSPSRVLAQEPRLFEIGANYNFVHTNVPPGGCGCFSLQGGAVWASYGFTQTLSAVGEVAVQHSGNVDRSGQSLLLTSYTIGPRYTLVTRDRFQPFGQILVGGVHAGGSFAPGAGGFPGSANSVAVLAGGGLNFGLNRHFWLRALQADYYLTHFANGVNNHQNNLRISAGFTLRFGDK
jgi:peptidoglycan-associated lipoprotein